MLISSAFAATDPAKATGGFPPFDTSTFASQWFWLLLTFGFLYWLMSKVALPRVAEIMEHRRRRIAGDLEHAASAQARADEAAAAYEKTMSEARTGAQETAREMRERIAAEAETRRASLERDLNARLSEAEASIARTKLAAMVNVSSIAEDAARDIVGQLTGKPADADAVRAAIAALKG